MKYPTTRFVFDRKNTASKKIPALVQVEILLAGKKKYVTTGVKVYKDQWNDKMHICNTEESDVLNKRIASIKEDIDNYIQDYVKNNKQWDWEAFSRYLNSPAKKNESFIGYIERRLQERTDLRESTKKCQRKILSSLMDFGKINTFDELTKQNIAAYYDWILTRDVSYIGNDGTTHKKKITLDSAAGYMKILRTYIHDAIAHGIIDSDPSAGISVKRSENKNVKWLTENELHTIEAATMPNGSLTRVRDLFIFMCYTGLAYSDAMSFKKGKIEEEENLQFIRGQRIKTGEEYIVLLLPKVKAILEKYDYDIPHYSNQQLNKRLKDVAQAAGIDKRITSHYARHTAAMLFLNKGIRLETVARILGHSSTRITQAVYSSVLQKTVGSEMSILL